MLFSITAIKKSTFILIFNFISVDPMYMIRLILLIVFLIILIVGINFRVNNIDKDILNNLDIVWLMNNKNLITYRLKTIIHPRNLLFFIVYLFLNFIISFFQFFVCVFYFIYYNLKYFLLCLTHRGELRVEIEKIGFPTWLSNFYVLFKKRPQYSAWRFFYLLHSKKKNDIFMLLISFINKLFQSLVGYPFWILKNAYEFSINLSNIIDKNEPNFLQEGFPFFIRRFLDTNVNYSKQFATTTRVYFDQKIIFNPKNKPNDFQNENEEKKENFTDFDTELSNRMEKNIAHIYIGQIDNPLGTTITSHAPKNTEGMEIFGKSGTVATINQIVHPKYIIKDMSPLHSALNRTGLHQESIRQGVITMVEFHRMCKPNMSVFFRGYGNPTINSLLYRDNFYRLLSNNNKKFGLLLPCGVIKLIDNKVTLLDQMSSREKNELNNVSQSFLKYNYYYKLRLLGWQGYQKPFFNRDDLLKMGEDLTKLKEKVELSEHGFKIDENEHDDNFPII